jgi:hypothetical protein
MMPSEFIAPDLINKFTSVLRIRNGSYTAMSAQQWGT